MEVSNIVRDVIKIDSTVYPTFYRSFTQIDFSLLVIRRLNEFLQQHPEMQDIVYIVAVYPAIKWAIAMEESSEALLRLLCDKKNAALFNKTKIVVEKASEKLLEELIECRKGYFKACHALVEGIEGTLKKIETYPEYGKKYQVALKVALGITGDNEIEISRYNINKYLPDALKLMHHCMLDMADIIDTVLTGVLPSNEKSSAMYHSIIQILQEYTQILWLSKNSDNQDNENEKVIKRYIELMNEIMVYIEKFPVDGSSYFDIMQTIVKLKPLGIPDEVAAERLEMSTYTFSIKKRRTLLILWSFLFCCEGDLYVKLLTDKN